MKRIPSILLCLVMVASVFAVLPANVGAAGDTIYVDWLNISGPWDGSVTYPYQYIQDGVDAANPGDTVFVFEGTYNENVVIYSTKTSLTLEGEDKDITIIDGVTPSKSVVFVQADSVNITGFTITGGLPNDIGIELNDVENCNVYNNIVSYNSLGIEISLAMENKIENNDCINNKIGIRVNKFSDKNVIANNTCNDNTWIGILMLDDSNLNLVANNNGSDNDYGIYLDYIHYNEIINNTVYSNDKGGIYAIGSSYNNITDNDVTYNYLFGLQTISSSNNTIRKNIFSNHEYGVWLWNYSKDNYLFDNYITSNSNYGLYLEMVTKNTIYHNIIIGNNNQAIDYDPANNNWHHPTWLEGNYWSDYTGDDDGSGSGKHAHAGDGIGDTDLSHPTTDFDFYPYVDENGWKRVHNIDKDLWYSTIQLAVDDADSGNTLEVGSGSYFENVVIDERINLTGVNKDTTIIDGDGSGVVIKINTGWVNVSGFTITNGDVWPDAGIELNGVTYCHIYNNNVSDNNGYGIVIAVSNEYNTIENNTISNNYFGIDVWGSSFNNLIYHNNIFDNTNQARDYGTNQWDNGYPSGGNTWSDWTSPDNNYDGFVDDPRSVSGGSNQDNYPFTKISMWEYWGPVHNIDKDLYYQTIQAGVSDADSGNTIRVAPGTFIEAVVISKTLTLIGEDKDSVIIDGLGAPGLPYGFEIWADWVNITGFTVNHTFEVGIIIAFSEQCKIENNNCSNNGEDGIRLWESFNNTISNNTFYSNGWNGINCMESSSNNTISNNTIFSNGGNGINLGRIPLLPSFSNNNTITENKIYSNEWDGIYLSGSNNTITNNSINSNDGYGIYLYSGSNHTIIYNNTISDNAEGIYIGENSNFSSISHNDITANIHGGPGLPAGIRLDECSYTNISNNNLSDNIQGITLDTSSNNTISNNSIELNLNYGVLFSGSDNTLHNNTILNNWEGIRIESGSNNEIYHNNIIGNTNQAFDSDPANNNWHNPTLLRGNFWSDYNGKDDGTGTGKHADPGDGIGDTLISHPGADYDNYPLMWPTFGGPVRNLDTDEYFDEIQAAIDDIDTLDGHEIEVEAGTYSENVVVSKTINLTGSGKAITIIEGDGTKDVVRITADWVNLTGFNITNSQSPYYGIYLEGVENCTVNYSEFSVNANMDIFIDGSSSNNNISDNDIISTNNAGIAIWPSSHHNTISGNTVKNHTQGIYVRGDNNEVEDNEVMENGKGIVLQGSDSNHNNITGNTITENTNFGIWLVSSAHHNNITDNSDISNNEYGIKLQSVSYNYITENQNPGISNNIYGIKLQGSSYNNISDNDITFNTDSNINLSSSSKNNNITNNPLITDSPYGIFIESGSTGNNISGNLHIDDNEFGIYMTNSNSNTINWNKFNTNPQYGIYVETSDEGEFYKNEIKNGDYGIKYHNSQDLLIVDNDIDCLIENIYDDPSSAIIKGNILRNAIYGIRLGDSNAVITDNIIINCTYGIYCSNSDAVISGNYISNNIYGIYIAHCSPTIENNTFEDNVYAIFVGPESDPIINNNTYVNNTYDEYLMIWSIDIDPDTLNLDSEGKWITCYIEAPEGIDLNDVDISTIKISKVAGIPVVIPAEGRPTNIGDHDKDGVPDLMVKFDRTDVQDAALPGDIEITVTGELTDGTPFEGYYIVRVINPGK